MYASYPSQRRVTFSGETRLAFVCNLEIQSSSIPTYFFFITEQHSHIVRFISKILGKRRNKKILAKSKKKDDKTRPEVARSYNG